MGFSTFSALPLINIHDVSVLSVARRMGVARKMLDAVKGKAKELDCCRITLEIRDDNTAADTLYRDYGFNDGGHPHRFLKLEI